jgi:hypothetical protein
VTTRAAYAAAQPRQLRSLVSVLLVAVVLAALTASVVLLPLAVVLLVGCSFLVPVIHLEDGWGVGAARRSLALAWRSLSTLLPVLVVCALVGSFLGLLLSALVFILLTAPFVVVSAVPPLVTAFMWPFVSLLVVYAYYNAVAGPDDPPTAVETQGAPSDAASRAE